MKQFFPMGKGEVLLLVYLIVVAVISFLPMWRTMEIGGMAVFGWLMAALMVTAPLLALLLFRLSDRGSVRNILNESTGTERSKSNAPSSDPEADQEA